MKNNGQYFQMKIFQPQSMTSKMSNNVYYYYYIVVRTLFLFCVYLARKVGIWLPLKKVDSDIDIYENKIKPLFLKFTDCENIKEYTCRNQNIEPIFYNRKNLMELMKIENNEIEKKWKRRVLIEYTPRGNIIMFYDAYKGSFSYYCDHSVVPIRILNIVAMKYVMRYFCMDFFVDEMALKGNTSPIIGLLNEEDKEDGDKIKKIFNRLSENTKIEYEKMPFLKPKKSTGLNNEKVEIVKLKEKRINKFLHLGKIYNYSIIEKKKISSIYVNEKTYVFKNVNYEEYKKNKKMKEETVLNSE